MPPKKATHATAPVERATKITRRALVVTASKPSRNKNSTTNAFTSSSTRSTVGAAPQRHTTSKKAVTTTGKRTSTTAAAPTTAAAAARTTATFSHAAPKASVAAKAKQSSATGTAKRSRTAAAAAAAPQRVEPPKKAVRKEAASLQQADNEKHAGNSIVSTSHDETPAQPSRTTSLLQRYLPSPSAVGASLVTQPWNVRDAVVFSTFLATLQLHFVRSCCRLLARLTTATSPAFLHAAALGEAALRPGSDAPVSSGRDGGVSFDVDQLVDRQELAYRTIRATIAASCTLGHRSCQVLWGPRGSGKHRILRLLAQDVRRTPKTFVVELHGALLRDDEAALGVIAQQLLAFLLSPQSQSLRQAHYLLRTGSFGFGQLFNFERRMHEAAASGGGAGSDSGAAKSSHKTGARPGMHTTRNNETSADSDADEDVEEDGDDDAGMMVTSTTTYLTGGAASALPHLQRALLLLKSQGCNIVVCIRDIDVFGIRCDQLLYVLSGLMHDSDGSHGGSNSVSSGGGLSLVLASAAPDIRQLEKRLSSRLTCETRYVPLLPWSLTGLMAATLHVAQLDAASQLQIRELTRQRADLLMHLRDGATRLRRVCEAPAAAVAEEGKSNGRGGGATTSAAAARKAKEKAITDVQTLMAALEARLHATEASLRDVRAQRRHELGPLDLDAGVSGNGGGVQEGGGSSSSSHNNTTSGILWSGSSSAAVRDAATSGWRWQPSEGERTAMATAAAAAAAPIASQQSATSSSSLVLPRSWTLNTLLSHPSLPLETQCVLCEELLCQLRRGCTEINSSSSSRLNSGGSSDSLARRIVFLGDAVENESATSATVLTVLTSVLCKAVSGAVDVLGDGGRRVLLVWMRGRLQHEAIPLPPLSASPAAAAAAAVEKAAESSACPPGLPEKVLTQWREAAQALVPPPLPTEAGGVGEGNGTELRGAFRLHSSSDADAPATAPVAAPATTPSLPLLALLPPHVFDLFADGQLVGMGYGSREMVLVLIYMHLHHTTGLRQRTVADLLEDVSSSLGTRAAAALDREAFRHAIRSLCRWRLLTVVEGPSQVVQLCGSDARLREFLLTVLAKQTGWCEAELGLDAREIMRFRNLV